MSATPPGYRLSLIRHLDDDLAFCMPGHASAHRVRCFVKRKDRIDLRAQLARRIQGSDLCELLAVRTGGEAFALRA
jgi:hypothetical protein